VVVVVVVVNQNVEILFKCEPVLFPLSYRGRFKKSPDIQRLTS